MKRNGSGSSLQWWISLSPPLPATDSVVPPTPPKDEDKTTHRHRALPLTLEEVKLWANTVMCWACDLRCQPDVFSGPWWCTQLSQNKMKIEAFNRKPTGNLSFLQTVAVALWLQLPKAPLHLVHRLGCHCLREKWIIARDVLVVFRSSSEYKISWL